MDVTSLAAMAEREIVPGYRARFVHTQHVTLAYWRISAGSALPEHAHLHEQTANLLEGSFSLTVDGETAILAPGEVVVIPSQARHSGLALTDCRILDVFYPVREEYR